MKMKRATAFVPSTALPLGLTPAIPDVTIKAEATQAAAPGVVAYAEKSVLSGNTFTSTYKYRSHGSLHTNTTTPDNRKDDANGVAF